MIGAAAAAARTSSSLRTAWDSGVMVFLCLKVLIVADSARRYCPIVTTAMLTRNQSWLAWAIIRPGREIPFPEDSPGQPIPLKGP